MQTQEPVAAMLERQVTPHGHDSWETAMNRLTNPIAQQPAYELPTLGLAGEIAFALLLAAVSALLLVGATLAAYYLS